MRARATGGVADHDGNACWAEVMAVSISVWDAERTSARGFAVAGLTVWKMWFEEAFCGSPLYQSWTGGYEAWAMSIDVLKKERVSRESGESEENP